LFVAAVQRMYGTLCVAALAEHYIQHGVGFFRLVVTLVTAHGRFAVLSAGDRAGER